MRASSSLPRPVRLRGAVHSRVLGVLLAGLLLPCSPSRGEGPGPAAPGPAPAAAPAPMPPAVREARALLRRHETGAALTRLRREGGVEAAHPERSWVLAQVAPLHEGLGPTRAEVSALPASGFRLALLALVSESPGALVPRLASEAARRGDPWVLLALAQTCLRLGREDQALGAARRADRAAEERGVPFVRVEAAQVAARALGELGRLDEAAREAARAAALSPEDSRPRALEAEVLRRSGRVDEARRALLGALQLDPGSAAYARRLADLLREEPSLEPEVGLLAGLEALAPAAANGELQALRGLVAERAGRREAAAARYEAALAAGANPVPVERSLRVLQAWLGHYRACAEGVRRALPPELLAAPENLLAPAWSELAAAAQAAPDRAAPEPARERLAAALRRVGAVEEALAVAEALEAPAGRALADSLRRQRAFELGLRALTEEGYRDAAHHRAPPGLGAYLARVAQLARQHLPADEAARLADPGAGLRRVAVLGAWLDHRTDSAAPLVAYFRRHGRYLVLGQRNEQPVEAVLLGLGYLARRQPLVTRGQAHVHDMAVGYDRASRAWMDAQGGLLSGACLADGLWLDADAALDTEHDARAALRLDPSLAASAQRLPLPPADGYEGPFAMGDAAGLHLRLLARYAAARPDDRWGSFRTLRAHESGHVIDIRRHLPVLRGLPATLRLLASVGFAPERMEAVLERRAQLAAVIDAPDPALALAEMVQMLPVVDEQPEVHAAGYADGLARLVRVVWSRPDLYPQIDRERRVLPQLDRLSDEQLRRAARAAVAMP